MSPIVPAPFPAPAAPRPAELREVAQGFEASFLAEMLKAAGLAKPRASFGGGAGEEAFASLLAGQYAERLAARGGIGIAEQVFRALIRREEAGHV